MQATSPRGLLTVAGLALLAAGCGEVPLDSGTADPHHHPDPLLAADAPPAVQKKIAELRRWSASFHTLEGAAAAGYTANIGCIDETVNGVDPSVARGMGYHVTRGDKDVINDGVIDIDEPELLVFQPHPNDAKLPKEQRLAAARLIGFDYYIPGDQWTDPEPPQFFGEPFNWSNAFQGWIRHIYLWGHNPEGMFADFNAAVPLCTELLNP